MDEKSVPSHPFLPRLVNFIMELVWIHAGNSSMWFYVPTLKEKGEMTLLLLLEINEVSEVSGWLVLVPPYWSWPCCFLNDLYCNPSKGPPPHPLKCCWKMSFLPRNWLIILPGKLISWIRYVLIPAPLSHHGSRKHVVMPSAHLAHVYLPSLWKGILCLCQWCTS